MSLPNSIDNIVLLSKSEANKHYDLKNENELKDYYGEEVYLYVTNKLKSLKIKYL